MRIRQLSLFLASMVVTRSRKASTDTLASGLKKVANKKSSSKPAAAKKRHIVKEKQEELATKNADSAGKVPLFCLPNDIVVGVLKNRPSKRNRSPYVADVFLEEQQREAIVHVPNLDMGGKCVPGATLLMKPARDRKGIIVGKDAMNAKYGTPKCEFIAQLLRVDESALGYEPAWVGAHPSLGEKIAEELVRLNLLGADFPAVKSFQREVRNVGGTDMRADFVIQHEDESLPPRVLEVKTVVDTDYSVSAVPDREKCVFTSNIVPYKRTAIFPWGGGNQKGPDGEKVVSARAIKHVRELTRLVTTKKFDATVLFVVIRNDAKAFRPNHEACPAFAKYLKTAEKAGVQILAKQVCWGEGINLGKCFEGPLLDISWPANVEDEDV